MILDFGRCQAEQPTGFITDLARHWHSLVGGSHALVSNSLGREEYGEEEEDGAHMSKRGQAAVREALWGLC